MRTIEPFPTLLESIPGSSGLDFPEAHEDLTITEALETMLVRDEHRPGEICFRDEHGDKCWVTEIWAQRFLRDHGSTHPSNYLNATGSDWRDDFFINC